jgi:uncharacterized repeat protein (TIGR03806 family)
MFIKQKYVYYFLFYIFLSACNSNDNAEVSPVIFDINQVPYQKLSDYNFFEGDMKDLNPVYGVLPYKLISKLFTDYSSKIRFVWMPENVKAAYTADYELLNFPVGTILIKNFYYDNVLPNLTTKILETRLIIRKTSGWVFATYQWNDEQTEANAITTGVNIPIDWMNDSNEQKHAEFRIPSRQECHTCHKTNEIDIPLGPMPQNINSDYAFADGTKNQLEKWVEVGYLEDTYPSTITTVEDWKDTSQPLQLRVRSYLDINCAHCHNDTGHASHISMRFAFHQNSDENLGICVDPSEFLGEGLSHIVSPRRPSRSAMYFRMNTLDETTRMPLIGRSIVHQEGRDLIEQWINSLEQNCN